MDLTIQSRQQSQSETRLSFGDKRRETALFYEGLVGAVGIEPTTFGLKGRCSTTELRP